MNKTIMRLALPNILSNLSVPLLGVVDTILVGHLDGTAYLGAIAVGGMIFGFIYWGFGFLRMGTTGLTAQAYGEQDSEEVVTVLGRALMVALGIAMLLLLLQIPIAWISFQAIHASEEVEHWASRYFYIRIWAAPATLALYAFHGWFLGMQNAKFPLILAVTVNIANIGFSLLFVKVFAMQSDGVALGTVCAQYLGLVLATVLLLRHYGAYKDSLKLSRLFIPQALKRFFTVNFDIFIRTLCLVATFSYVTAKSAEFGDVVLAANSILLQLWSIAAFGIDGFAFAAESLVGQYVGAKERQKLYQAIRYLFGWMLLLGGIISLIFGVFMKELLGMFTHQKEVIEMALSFQWWTIVTPLVSGICYLWDGIFLGATESRSLRNSMLFCTFAVFFPIFYVFRVSLGNHSLWLALVGFMLFRGITLSFYAYRRIPHWVSIQEEGRIKTV